MMAGAGERERKLHTLFESVGVEFMTGTHRMRSKMAGLEPGVTGELTLMFTAAVVWGNMPLLE